MGSCATSVDGVDTMNEYGTYICDEGQTITLTPTGSGKILHVYYGVYWGVEYNNEITYEYHYHENTYTLLGTSPTAIPCTNDEFDCDPYAGKFKNCRYEWVGIDGEAVDSGDALFVDGVPFVPSSSEPAVSTESLSDRVSVGPLEIEHIAAIVFIIVSLINLCCILRMCTHKCFRKGGAVVEYREVHALASETED